ncbi:MAG: 16S rRNA (guanine(966)-N(2))-methyltransferase RsmD [Bacillota bacterium]
MPHVRIIAGSAKGMKLKTVRGNSIRPTGDRVKEALFNICGSRTAGTVFIDLFAGSGAIGIEALSRGADCCVFVEHDRRHLAMIKDNLSKTGLAGRARLMPDSVPAALKRLSREKLQADLIFMDPPYLSPLIPAVLQIIHVTGLLKESGLVIVEHAAENRAWSELYRNKRQKRYGGTCLTFIEHTDLAAAAAEEES